MSIAIAVTEGVAPRRGEHPGQMPEPRAQRTLVKSPPELWAEISDQQALMRHLGEFGEIRITRSDPETTVAWEGDRVRGTVELEASGWGTKVTLTAEVAAPAQEEVAAPVAAPARATAPLPAGRRPGLLGLFRRRPRGVPAQSLRTSVAGSDPAQSLATTQAPPGVRGAPAQMLRTSSAGSDPAHVEAVLVGVLDELGSATKRPFSR